MRLETGTWILVLDGAKGLILENVGDGRALDLRVISKIENDATDSRGEATTSPTLVGDLPEGTADATLATGELGFAEEMAAELYKAAHDGRFEHLVLVAPPKVLGALRRKLHKEVADRVVGEVHKTLTGHPVDRIEAIVARELDAA